MNVAQPPAETTLRAEGGAIIRLAAPLTLAQIGMVAMSLVDTAIIGRVSVHDLAGASIGRSLAFAAASLGMGVGLSIDPLAAQALGAGEPARAWSALGAALRAGAITTVACVALAFLGTAALRPIGVDALVIDRARAYLAGYTPGIFFFIAFIAGKSFLQAHGITRPTIVAAVLANAINLVVCNLLVRGDDALAWAGLAPIGLPRLGAFGAGLASSIGTFVIDAVVLGAAMRLRPPDRARGAPVPVSTALRLGLPVGLQILAEIGVFTSVGVAAGRLGAIAVSAHQVALGLASFTFMGALSVGSATAVRVGHAVGAGVSPRRAGVVGLLLGSAVMTGGAVAFSTAPRPLIALFSPDADVIAVGVPLLGIAAVFQLFDGVQAVAAGALRGAGDVRVPFLANIGAHWLVGFPLSLIFGFSLGLGARGLWIGLTAGLVTISILLTARFFWITRGVIARV